MFFHTFLQVKFRAFNAHLQPFTEYYCYPLIKYKSGKFPDHLRLKFGLIPGSIDRFLITASNSVSILSFSSLFKPWLDPLDNDALNSQVS